MKFTDMFVRRPVVSLVLSLLVLLLGLVAANKLPIRQYPSISSATLTITTQFPGASPETMQAFVTQTIAQSVATVEDIDYMTSDSIQGKSVISIRLKLNADSNKAMTQVMAKVNEVKYRLPEAAYDPVIEKSAGEALAVIYVGFATKTMTTAEISDYIEREVKPKLSSIKGVGSVIMPGSQKMAMRIWLDADRMAARNISATDLADALRANNVQAAPGRAKGYFTINDISVNTELKSVNDFRDMVVKNTADGIVHLRDIAKVELSSASVDSSALMDGENAVYIGLNAAPSANPLDIVAAVNDELPGIKASAPSGMTIAIPYEQARFIKASIDQVKHTLIEAIVIVVLVIYLSLGNLRAVLVPVVTIPLSMLGAAVFMVAFGFSINLLTLLAMVLAIGLVVDDAIIIVENVHRHIEEGKSPTIAALIGAREVAKPVIGMTLTLAAVYSPIGFMGGLTGELFKEFAFTLAASVIASGFIALTLSPVMSSYLLNAHGQQSFVSRFSESFFHSLSTVYEHIIQRSLQHRWITVALTTALIVSLPVLLGSIKTELAPVEDQAIVFTMVKSPQNANIDYVEAFSHKWNDALKDIPEGDFTWLINGSDGLSNSIGGVNLVDWSKRHREAGEVQADMQARVGSIEGNNVFSFQLPPLPGSTGGLPVQAVLKGPADHAMVYQVMEAMKSAARASGLFAVVDSDLDFNNAMVRLDIDRTKANRLGVTMKDIGDILSVLVGEDYITRFQMQGRSYDVIPQAIRKQRLSAESLTGYYVKSALGGQVPLSNLVSVSYFTAPNKLTQFDQMNASTFQAVPAPGVTVGQAVDFLEQYMKAQLPPGYSYDWLSDARQYKYEGGSLSLAFVFALIVIYLVLSAQYESLRDPLIILISVPLSVFGALVPLALGMGTINIYTQIGLVTLIGLVSKHGILMVEFANELQREQRMGKLEAVIEAAKVRLRPILMTTAAMVVGLIPLIFASGAGSHSRHDLGVVLVFGMLVGTLFTLFVVPVTYSFISRDHNGGHRSQRERELEDPSLYN